MRFYLDSSVTVAAVSAEAATVLVLDWIGKAEGELVVSDWVTTETVTALSRKLRMKLISKDEHRAAVAAFERQFVRRLLGLAVTHADFRRAASLAQSADAALRAGDALHLAVAEHHGAILCTRDGGQAAAGKSLGIGTLLL